MNKSTTIINHLNTDRVTEIIIDECKYIIFTLSSYRNLIVIEVSEKNKPILLFNRNYSNRNALSNGFDKIIIKASKAIDNDDFVSSLDTYIDLYNGIHNETTDEIIDAYKIIVEDYNL